MSEPDPRQRMRDLIAEKINEKMRSERMDDNFDGQDYADAVMELFPEVDVAREYHGPGYVIPIGRGRGRFGDGATHIRYEVRTSPAPAP